MRLLTNCTSESSGSYRPTKQKGIRKPSGSHSQTAQASLADMPSAPLDSQHAAVLIAASPASPNVQDDSARKQHTSRPEYGNFQGQQALSSSPLFGSSSVTRSAQVDYFRNAQNFTIEKLVQIGTQRVEIKHDHDRENAERRAEEAKKKAEEEERERATKYEKWKNDERDDWETKANEALRKLKEKAMLAALLDSNDRGYVPTCSADTRRAIRARFIKWGRNAPSSCLSSEKEPGGPKTPAQKLIARYRARTVSTQQEGEVTERLLWLFGPAGVGKSAVAQSVSEALKAEDIFAAGFFFSRPNNRSEPDSVVPTVVYQLALLIEPYRLILGQLFRDNPQILDQGRAALFHQLIT
ncbi:hypothetical protein NP233_g12135 [Leucocoprinus birnbaumii]|uniref:Nephrocystin 3-like N-terminal domain-containing protein n=1 Tax=Leucocoprinus birnbaumii TaxID=56174 RepID=A0AAD5VFN6_9AGAR|nr:hypothetical protein NP233_g12135 [Leucocoprinus birnbaumii]